MKGTLQVGLVLGGSAICFCYALFFVDLIALKIIHTYLAGATPADLLLLIAGPTRFASDHKWVFMLAFALICPGATMACDRGGGMMRCLVSGLGGQALVFWIAMFCYCYDGFCGDVCMHHGPSFEVAEFFPVGMAFFRRH